MTAITGTRRGFKELVDGTIRVTVDIDPECRRTFLTSFSEIDMPIALAPLKPGHTSAEKPKLGPLALLAVQWCKDKQFQEWAEVADEAAAADWVKRKCIVSSRRQLDEILQAGTLFQIYVRGPYMHHLENTKNATSTQKTKEKTC